MVFLAQLAEGKGCTHSPFHSIGPIHSSYDATSTPLQKAVFWIPDPDPDSISSMQKLPTEQKFFLKFHVLKCWMFSFDG
jgi:hypothetical protein